PGKRNAFTWEMYDQLQAACTAIAADQAVRVAILHGDAEGGFAAGTEIGQFAEFLTAADGIRYEERVAAMIGAVAAVPVPTIAMVQRDAVGAGLAVAAMCDIVVAERGSRFGAPIARTLGNCLPIAVVDRLRSRLGVGRAMAMLLTAHLLDAEDLTATGFVTRVVPSEDIEEEVDRMADRLATSAPLTIRALKEMGRRLDTSPVLPDAEDLLALCYGSDDFHEGVAAFIKRQRPEWSGR
ncbi:MAG TPA: enoyl-CoA hydratase, partial [Galbitalea sp.]